MEIADESLTRMALGDNAGHNMHMGMQNPVMNPGYQAGDEHLFVKFFKRPKQDHEASKEEGRPIFKDVDYIEILQPGNKENIIQRPVSKGDINRFNLQYQKYKANEDQAVEGTLLEEAPFVTRSQVEELRYMNVFTVEQLAGMSDGNAQNARGFQTLKQKAQAYLESASGSAGDTSLADEVNELRNQLSAMEENNKVLQKRIDELEEED